MSNDVDTVRAFVIANAELAKALVESDNRCQDKVLVKGIGMSVSDWQDSVGVSVEMDADVTIIGTTPTLTIGDGDEEDTALVFDGNAQDYYVGLDDTDDSLKIGLGSAVGTTPAIDINAAMQQEALSSEAARIQQTTQQRHLKVEQNRAADEANAQVAAAASGTGGQSVELTATEIESSAGRAAGNIETQAGNLLGGIEQASRDINISAEAQKSNLEPLDTRGQLLNVFGAGLQGFLASRG